MSRQEKVTIDAYEGMKVVKEMKKEGYSLKMLVVYMREVYDKHDRGEKLTLRERFILGLRYSEFLATSDTEYGYVAASMKKDEYLRVLGIDNNKLVEYCRKYVGLN